MSTITTDILQLIIQAEQGDAQEVLKSWKSSVAEAKIAQEALSSSSEKSTNRIKGLTPEIIEARNASADLASSNINLKDTTEALSQANIEAADSQDTLQNSSKEAADTYDEVVQASKNASSSADEYADSAKESGNATDEMAQKTESSAQAFKKQAIEMIASYLTIRQGIRIFKESISLGAENIDSYTRLKAVIKATGNTVGITASEIKTMASDMRAATGISEATIISAAAGLNVFKNISGEVFEKTLTLSADLAALWGDDFSAASKKLGRAMEDPARGLEQLRESGIVLSADTELQIRKFVELNDVYSAQTILLNELENRVGGLSEEMGESASGGLLQFKTVWKELLGDIGSDILEASWFQSMLVSLDGFREKRAANKVSGELNFQDGYGDLEKYLENLDIGELKVALKVVEEGPSSKTLFQSSDDYAKSQQRIAEALRVRISAQEKLDAKSAKVAAENAQREENARSVIERETALLEEQERSTVNLGALYASTSEGRLSMLSSELENLETQLEIDRTAVEWWEKSGYEAPAWVDEAKKRIPMYDAVIQQKTNELEGLQKIEPSAVEQAMTNLFGDMSAGEFAMNIPLSFDFGRSETDTLSEQLTGLKSKISEVWSAGPAEGDTGEWQAALDILAEKYFSISDELRTQQEFTEAKKGAELELAKLLSDQEAASLALSEYAEALSGYEKEGLLTAQERIDLYNIEKARLGLVAKESLTFNSSLKEITGSLKEQFFTAEAMGSRLSNVFVDIGSAMAEGESGLDAVGDGLASFAGEILGQISSMALAAGLRMIVELGVAGIPAAIGLFAIGGVAGIGAGFFSSSGSGIDSSLLSSLDKEAAIREKLNEQLQEQLDVEVDLLRRQLDRNLISEEEYRTGVNDINDDRNYSEAQSNLLEAAKTEMSDIDSTLKEMSGWKKFWGQEDENLIAQSEAIAALAAKINTATPDELRTILSQLGDLGVDLTDIPAFANGGEFITSGPQLALLGDNSSGREHVKITPLGSSGSPTASPVINIYGGIYGVEDLYNKLKVAGLKIGDRNQ